MKKLFLCGAIAVGSLISDSRPATAACRAGRCAVQEDPVVVAAREERRKVYEDKLKWVYAAGGLGLVAVAMYQFLRATHDVMATSNRPKAPWENL